MAEAQVRWNVPGPRACAPQNRVELSNFRAPPSKNLFKVF